MSRRVYNRSRQMTQTLLKLRELILSGEFKPGRKIGEQEAVDASGASRGTVKMALAELEHQGFIHSYHKGNFIVSNFSPEDVHDAIELRGVLEGLAAKKLAKRGLNDEQKAVFQNVIDEIDGLFEGYTDFEEIIGNYIQFNAEFHALLLEYSESSMLQRSLDHVVALPFTSPNDFVVVGASSQKQFLHLQIAQDQHKMAFKAICERDGARAEAVIREHALMASRNFQESLKMQSHDYVIPSLALVSS